MPVDHVVVLCLENRSFDHMLGFLDHPDGDFAGLSAGRHDNPGWAGGPSVAATPTAKRVIPFGPDHSHDAVMEQLAMTGKPRRPTNRGFVRSYERKARGLAPAKFGGLLAPVLDWFVGRKQRDQPVAKGRGPLVMACQAHDHVPVLSQLALSFAVCDHWFCSVPGETWPNRNFLHAATSDGEVDIELRPYTDRTIFELLEANGRRWRIYHDDTPQVWAFPKLWDTPERHGNWFPIAKFAEHVARGDLPAYSFIEPNHRPPLHMVGDPPAKSDSQHPENNIVPNASYDDVDDAVESDFARGEALIASIYEALRSNPDLFARTMFVITYDEHGGLYDHVGPPTGIPAPSDPRSAEATIQNSLWHRKVAHFDFTMLGPRVPTVIVSPLIPSGVLDRGVHDHASVPATLRALFAPHEGSLTRRDAWSPTFHHLLTLAEPRTDDLPDLSAWTTVSAPPAAVAPAPARVSPSYYDAFVGQAEEVRSHMKEVGEPELATTERATDPASAAAVTQAFMAAAHRHRHPG